MIVRLECNNREFLKIGEIAAHIYYDGNDSVQRGGKGDYAGKRGNINFLDRKPTINICVFD